MEIRFANSPAETKQMNTEQLRKNYLVENLMEADKLTLVYSHYDRVIIGGVKPVGNTIELKNEEELKAEFFLQRRELGIINVGGAGVVTVDSERYALEKLECLYVGRGAKSVSFASNNENEPALFYMLSAPAHKEFPTTKYTKEQAAPVNLGDVSTSNKRTIYKYIHDDGIQSCQLVMGLTVLEQGCVWNSVPPHTHTRRMEVYYYFDLPKDQRLFHMMGEPLETRHLIMANNDAVISPPWSVHFGSGTSNYGFIWGMAGENKQFTDMDPAPISTLL
ncbi:MAG TPA: 5-dehydro-4-deoxy-D-glucuronate isomerase [Niabella sp.]|nr:5-dehydro-4-deoxy-D-glucuronate isomerase [Niabella sp.]HOZ97749.1 5-dehydro-4-deoxy-D-glucuronate isomerase [Niabella sp.]HQW14064.1 5-dehydro-4-deoxy-D-glucuronate isomerase [Niabella sp.]HQX19393.1 5-dehydro-4-deoxy-D-glucuronate isomerase [Niabella sp.]HQX40254.1 5-dehydro-4-deoxy-D-glucuronate isomerase [Niabella sp.]